MRIQIGLKCEECGTRNYYTKKEKSKKDKLKLKKYCPKCNKHTVHNETKV